MTTFNELSSIKLSIKKLCEIFFKTKFIDYIDWWYLKFFFFFLLVTTFCSFSFNVFFFFFGIDLVCVCACVYSTDYLF